MLDEQLIQDMFEDEFNKSNSEHPLQEVSLNFTVSSRSSKPHRKDPFSHDKDSPLHELNIFKLAENELGKFNEWFSQSQRTFQCNLDSVAQLLAELDNNPREGISEEDLYIIKNQLFKKQNECERGGEGEKGRERGVQCYDCNEYKDKISQLEQTLAQTLRSHQEFKKEMEDHSRTREVEGIKEELLGKVEINLLTSEVTQLNGEISVLKSEKSSLSEEFAVLQKTFLFNKTKNSQLMMKMELQKSKGLSAAKNSTNSSELMNRNQTIMFIDPIESDVEEWLRFFENQKNRYMSMCKKEEGERIRQLGRSFTKEEKTQLHGEGRLFVIFSSLKDIWKNLVKIRENTTSFLASESSKNFLKDKFNSNNDCEQGLIMKEESDRLNSRLNKLMKLNQYLLCEKQNLQEINEGLRGERMKQNVMKNKLESESRQRLAQTEMLMARVRQFQEERRCLVRGPEKSEVRIEKRYKKMAQSKVVASGSRGHRSSMSCYKVQLS